MNNYETDHSGINGIYIATALDGLKGDGSGDGDDATNNGNGCGFGCGAANGDGGELGDWRYDGDGPCRLEGDPYA